MNGSCTTTFLPICRSWSRCRALINGKTRKASSTPFEWRARRLTVHSFSSAMLQPMIRKAKRSTIPCADAPATPYPARGRYRCTGGAGGEEKIVARSMTHAVLFCAVLLVVIVAGVRPAR